MIKFNNYGNSNNNSLGSGFSLDGGGTEHGYDYSYGDGYGYGWDNGDNIRESEIITTFNVNDLPEYI